MSTENLPPFRVREADGSPDVLPVYMMTLSDNLSIVNQGGGRIVLQVTTGGGGGGAVYAPTGGAYLTYQADTALSSERVIAGSDNIVIVNSGTSFLISATTSARVYAATDNSYVVIGAAGDLTSERILTAGMGINLVDAGGGGNATLTANTALMVTTARTIATGVGLSGGGDLSADRTLIANTALLVTTGGGSILGSLRLIGQADTSQLLVEGNLTQTNDIVLVSRSNNGPQFFSIDSRGIIEGKLWSVIYMSTSFFALAANGTTPIINCTINSDEGAVGGRILLAYRDNNGNMGVSEAFVSMGRKISTAGGTISGVHNVVYGGVAPLWFITSNGASLVTIGAGGASGTLLSHCGYNAEFVHNNYGTFVMEYT